MPDIRYHHVQSGCLGAELLECVFKHLDIVETDYFGLQYTDEKSVSRWIDTTKSIKKQTRKQKGEYTQLENQRVGEGGIYTSISPPPPLPSPLASSLLVVYNAFSGKPQPISSGRYIIRSAYQVVGMLY